MKETEPTEEPALETEPKKEPALVTEDETPSQKRIKRKDLGLQIFAKNSEPFSEEGMDLRKLATGLLKGTYK